MHYNPDAFTLLYIIIKKKNSAEQQTKKHIITIRELYSCFVFLKRNLKTMFYMKGIQNYYTIIALYSNIHVSNEYKTVF